MSKGPSQNESALVYLITWLRINVYQVPQHFIAPSDHIELFKQKYMVPIQFSLVTGLLVYQGPVE